MTRSEVYPPVLVTGETDSLTQIEEGPKSRTKGDQFGGVGKRFGQVGGMVKEGV